MHKIRSRIIHCWSSEASLLCSNHPNVLSQKFTFKPAFFEIMAFSSIFQQLYLSLVQAWQPAVCCMFFETMGKLDGSMLEIFSLKTDNMLIIMNNTTVHPLRS